MTRIALVKTSSMGDVIHTFPVVSDIRAAIPAATVVWVVEESFADLPGLHPGVASVSRVAIRRWRKSLWAGATRQEIRRARDELAASPFDQVIDLQGLLKSAWISRWANGPRAGLSYRCAREPLASLFYQRRIDVDMRAHAVERGRQLAGAALGYQPQGLPRFELRPLGERLGCVGPLPYVVLLHATSRADKCWPIDQWRQLIAQLTPIGLEAVLPWGSPAERAQAAGIAADLPGARVLPALTLAQCALLLRDAAGVVGVDTGLTHLSAALDRPTVALFAATAAWRFGPYWTPRAKSLGEQGSWPGSTQVFQALECLMRPCP